MQRRTDNNFFQNLNLQYVPDGFEISRVFAYTF